MADFAVPGVGLGHATRAGTGVTVVALPPGTIGAGEVRGGAPASRELALLEPTRTVIHVDAIVFAGGSAFGLAAADGVVSALATEGRGVPTSAGPVPIVPAACVFDLGGPAEAVPGPDDGAAAFAAARIGGPATAGRIGAGTGTTVGKWRGRVYAVPTPPGTAARTVDGATIAAVAVVNAVGDVVGADGRVLAGSTAPAAVPPFPDPAPFAGRGDTTLVAVVTDAACDKVGCFLLAQSAHDGLARAIVPAHTRFDGDLAIAAATGVTEVPIDRLRVAATEVTAAAIRAAVAPGPVGAP
ncbi:MAG: P1 family peptidase [Actinomycetota bacterium]